MSDRNGGSAMKLGWLYSVGIISCGTILFGAQPVQAKNATGPYYSVPSWDQKLKCDKGKEDACPRFTVLSDWGNAAVLDNETGLVWERSPSKNTFQWNKAQLHCNNLDVSHRKGWRLPMVQELASLVDTSQTNPSLPSGNPFQNVQKDYFYWSVSAVNDDKSSKWIVEFHEGKVIYREKTAQINAWCVRSGLGLTSQ
jgi:hypothetical protein